MTDNTEALPPLQAIDWIDDFIARCNGDDRGACEPVNIVRAALAQRQQYGRWICDVVPSSGSIPNIVRCDSDWSASLPPYPTPIYSTARRISDECEGSMCMQTNRCSYAPCQSRAALAQRQQVPELVRADIQHLTNRAFLLGIKHARNESSDDSLSAIDAELSALTAAPSAQAELRMIECPGCGMEFADGALHDANLELHLLKKAAQAEPVAFTSQHQIEELRARKAGFAGRPDYLYAHAKPGGIYTVPLYAAPPTAQAEPQKPLKDEQIKEACSGIYLSNHGGAGTQSYDRAIARAIERAHGIGKQEGTKA